MSEEIFLLIPGRTSRQGTALNVGKSSEEYRTETSLVSLNAEDMSRLGLTKGDRVRLTSEVGSVELVCREGGKDEISPGLLFVPYGPPICALIGGETHGSGMPDSKQIDVRLEKIQP